MAISVQKSGKDEFEEKLTMTNERYNKLKTDLDKRYA